MVWALVDWVLRPLLWIYPTGSNIQETRELGLFVNLPSVPYLGQFLTLISVFGKELEGYRRRFTTWGVI